jgi:hypothetical protein
VYSLDPQIGHLGFLKMASHRLLSSLSANDVGRLAEPLLILLSENLVVWVLQE